MASAYHGAHKAAKGGNFISGAVSHPGVEQAAAKRAGVSTQTYLHEHANDPGTAGKRARLGLTLTKLARSK